MVALLSLPFISFSQIELIAGPGVSYNSTWILNPNMLIEGDQNPDPTFTWGTGIDADLRLTKWLSFHTGYNSGEIRQNFELQDENENTFNAHHSLKTSNIPLVLRWGGAFYCETGFQHTGIKNANWSFNSIDTDVSDRFVQSSWMAVGGFGGNIGLAPKVKLNIGFRTAYGMSDFKGVDAWGRDYEEITYFSELASQGVDITEIPGSEEYLDEFEQYTSLVEEFDKLAKTYALSVGVYMGVKIKLIGAEKAKAE